MTRFLYFFSVLLISAVFIGTMLHVPEPKEIFDPLFANTEATGVIFLNNSGSIVEETESLYRLNYVSPADIVVSAKEFPEPKISQGEDGEIIEIGKGLYFFNLSDLILSTRVKHSMFEIDHIAKGAYFIDTRGVSPRIYSLTALLNITLLSDGKRVTEFQLFPSTFFLYDPALSSNLINADNFRISQVQTLVVVNFKNESAYGQIFGTGANLARAMFDAYKKFNDYQKIQIRELTAQFKVNEANQDISAIEQYGLFFVNPEKKRAILENSFLGLLQNMVLLEAGQCLDDCKKYGVSRGALPTRLKDRLKMIESVNPEYAQIALETAKKYLYLVKIDAPLHDAEYYKNGNSLIVKSAQSLFGNEAKGVSRYQLFSEMFIQYVFSEGTLSELELNLSSYTTYLLSSKTLGKSEFLGFVFLLEGLLSREDSSIDVSTFQLITQMFSISNSYLETLTDDGQKFSILSVFYYTFNTITAETNKFIRSKYFTGTDENLVLKGEYLSNNQANVSKEFLTQFGNMLSAADETILKNKEFYYGQLSKQQINSDDYQKIFNTTLDKLKFIESVLVDYPVYRKNISLAEGSRTAVGLVLEEEKFSEKDLTTYIESFNGVVGGSIQIKNNFIKDGYFDVSVLIFNQEFNFLLRPKGKVIERLTFINQNGERITTYKDASISLEERETFLNKMVANTQSPTEREKLSFKNYFKNTFFLGDTKSTVTTNVNFEERPRLSPEMQLFIENELLNGDFKFTKDILNINIQNIDASIQRGGYVINLNNFTMTAQGGNRSYNLVLSASYLFDENTHAFSNIKAKIKSEQFAGYGYSGRTFIFSPSIISVTEFRETVKNIGPLIDKMALIDPIGKEDVTLYFDRNSIMIAGMEFPLTTE